MKPWWSGLSSLLLAVSSGKNVDDAARRALDRADGIRRRFNASAPSLSLSLRNFALCVESGKVEQQDILAVLLYCADLFNVVAETAADGRDLQAAIDTELRSARRKAGSPAGTKAARTAVWLCQLALLQRITHPQSLSVTRLLSYLVQSGKVSREYAEIVALTGEPKVD